MAANPRDILLRPIITEKTSVMLQDNKYTFQVPLTANKVEIRQAVEQIFKVKVLNVNTVRVFGKTKRMGKYVGKRSDYKKAIVKLAEGNTIPLFEGMRQIKWLLKALIRILLRDASLQCLPSKRLQLISLTVRWLKNCKNMQVVITPAK